VSVTVGAPITATDDESADLLTKHLRDTMSGMLDSAQHNYADAHLGAGAWWQPQHLGGAAPGVLEAAEIEQTRIDGPSQ
jgi:hypothetical protein